MVKRPESLEEFWDYLLSREPERVLGGKGAREQGRGKWGSGSSEEWRAELVVGLRFRMVKRPESVQELWDYLLAGEPERVRDAFSVLDENEKQAVVEHLRRMASEAGWQPGQRDSARAALEIITTKGAKGNTKDTKK